MKKNKIMRFASILMVLTILSTCAISGTFAKYVTSAEGTDSARVAKFGVSITANGTTFADSYATDDGAFAEAESVITSGAEGDALVAPGTSGAMASMALEGEPEVAVRVSYEGAFAVDGWMVDGAFYCPLEITVNADTVKGTDYADAAAFAAAVNEKIAGYSKDYAANTNLETIGADALAISWAWAFEGNDDVKDTALGDAAAADAASTVTLKVTTTVTQID